MPTQISPDAVFLRVKRKREEEPSTHMVAEITMPGAKKLKEMSLVPGVFTYAETVEDSALFEDDKYMTALNERISTLTHSTNAEPPSSSPSPMSISTAPDSKHPPELHRRQSSPTKPGSKSYTIVQRPIAKIPTRPSRTRLNAPPEVTSSKEPSPAPPIKAPFAFYEAIESSSAAHEPEAQKDPAMEQFSLMVNDYLKLNNIDVRPPAASSQPELVSPTEQQKAVAGSPDDYVYDVFYFALKDVNDVNALLAQEAASIGTIQGLPYWEIMELYPDEGSDDSAKDEADEDSNDEDYYRNDYPDDEDEVETSDEEAEVERAWRPWCY